MHTNRECAVDVPIKISADEIALYFYTSFPSEKNQIGDLYLRRYFLLRTRNQNRRALL